jgi:hypothetical protein
MRPIPMPLLVGLGIAILLMFGPIFRSPFDK